LTKFAPRLDASGRSPRCPIGFPKYPLSVNTKPHFCQFSSNCSRAILGEQLVALRGIARVPQLIARVDPLASAFDCSVTSTLFCAVLWSYHEKSQ